MRLQLLLFCLLSACASPARPPPAPAPREVELPPPPPITGADPAHAPSSGRIERDTALADRFTAEKQSVAYDFDADAGELSLFPLMTWGYARGWHSLSQLRIRDADGALLHEETRKGGAAWFGFTSFVAPRTGRYRYEIELQEGYYRYRLARYSSYHDRAAGSIERLCGPGPTRSYLKSGADRARFSLHVARGELLALKVLNDEEDGRAERRTSTALRLKRGMQGGFLHPQFRLALELDGEPQPAGGHYALWRAPCAGELVVEVGADPQGDGGRFELALVRNPRRIEVRGTVVDREGAPLGGVGLEFLLGADEDPVGSAVASVDGTYVLAIPPGPYSIRMHGPGGRGLRVVRATAFDPRTMDLAWIEERLVAPEEDQ